MTLKVAINVHQATVHNWKIYQKCLRKPKIMFTFIYVTKALKYGGCCESFVSHCLIINVVYKIAFKNINLANCKTQQKYFDMGLT